MTQDLQSFFHDTLKKAGDVLNHRFGKKHDIKVKFDQSLCTEADLACEAFLIDHIQKYFPDDSILSEEAGLLKKTWSPDNFVWVLDPLDGTTNFAHHFGYFCVSVARCRIVSERGYVSEAAGIQHPTAHKTYFAQKGGGCFVNGERVRILQTRPLGESFLVTGLDFDDGTNSKKDYDIFYTVARKCHALRSTGAAALDLALVAEGVYHAFWQRYLAPWDRAAGGLLVSEAGGMVCNYAGSDFDLQGEGTIAGIPSLVKYLKDLF